MSFLFTLHLAFTFYMTGVIWLVQLVHYPMMGRVGSAFGDCQELHLSRVGVVVGPAMLIEGLSGVLLLPGVGSSRLLLLASVLLGLIWISTAFVQVPCHRRLSNAFDQSTHASLVRWNWFRTAGWTTRAFLLLLASKEQVCLTR